MAVPAPRSNARLPVREQNRSGATWDAPASDSGVTRHDYCFKTDGGYPEDWTRIANSAVGGTNQAGFTVPGLTNEVAHTFQLRAVSAAGNGAAAEAAPVTPTPGICDRTQQVQDDILGQLSGVSACAAVTVADLATVTALSYLEDTSITSLKSGDFAGLTAVTQILLGYNQLGALPANLFSGLTSLQELSLETSGVTSLPTDAFSGLTALTSLSLGANSSLGSLPENQFSELTKLHTLRLSSIGMTELPAGLFSGLSELREINLNGNGLTSLPVGVFSGLSKLEQLYLGANRLTSLPARLFSGLTALTTLDLSGNPTDPMPLTVTLEKVGTGQVRAKVLAGAPSDLVLPVSVENGTLALGATGLRVSGGSVKNAKRVDGRKDLWEVTVKPGSLGDVTVTLAGGRACGTAGAVCTGDGRALSATISTTVLGPVALSVADARVREASDVTLDFAVTLSRASRAPVAVAYATADGSATAGSDYTATSGTLTFAAGETAKTVSVPVLDDAHDEGEETLTLRLSAATGAVIADGVATGTIENTDHMPAAWLARFGRTVTDQVLEAVEARLAAPRTAGARATLAGQALPSWDDANDTAKAAAGDNADASDRALRADAVKRLSILTPDRRAKLTPLSGTAEVVPVANRGDPRGFV